MERLNTDCDWITPTIVILHGAGGNYKQGSLIGESLINKEMGNIITLTRPATDLYSQANYINKLLERLGIDKVILMGWSAGADVALQFALSYPHKTMGLILESIGLNPNLLSNSAEMKNLIKDLSPDMVIYNDSNKYSETRANYIKNDKNQTELLQKFIKSFVPLNIKGLWADLNNSKIMWETDAYPFEKINVPTLIIESTTDALGYYPNAQELAQIMPNAKLISVKDTGHFIWFGPNTRKWKIELFNFVSQFYICKNIEPFITDKPNNEYNILLIVIVVVLIIVLCAMVMGRQ